MSSLLGSSCGGWVGGGKPNLVISDELIKILKRYLRCTSCRESRTVHTASSREYYGKTSFCTQYNYTLQAVITPSLCVQG